MSVEDLDNWDPMAEDYSNPKFNSYSNPSTLMTDTDDCSLYIKSVPASLSQDAFVALMSENGRKIVRSKLYPPRDNFDFTVGLVSFEKSQDAADVMKSMNRKPPLNLNITYAQKKNFSKKGPVLESNSNSMQTNLHSHPRPHSSLTENQDTIPVLGKGRGGLMKSFNKCPALRIQLDGNKRTSYEPKVVEEEKKLAVNDTVDIPKLVDNPFLTCLACDKVGQFSCINCKKPYCSQTCQVNDWPKHKLTCSSTFSPQKKSKEGVKFIHKNSRDSSYVSESSSSESEKVCTPSVTKPQTHTKPACVTPEKPPRAFKVTDIKSSTLPSLKHVEVKVCHIGSPSKFWVHLKSTNSLLSKMEIELTSCTKKMSSLYETGHVYCTLQAEKFKRINIVKVHSSKSSLVQFLDYGNTDVIQNDKIYLLPEKFKEIPYQAICCKLVDVGDEKDIVWNEEDTTYFQMHCTENNYYTAHILKQMGNIYEVNLTNEDGISLYSMISGLKNLNLSSLDVRDNCSNENSSKPLVPTVYSNLKDNAQVSIIGIEFEDDKFWGILDDGSGVAEQVAELESTLANLKTKEVNMYVEEGDVVAGFSVNFNQFYRCSVIKRLKEKFLVHFIDFGNKEEVTKLCELTPELLNKCCYIVCCMKPQSISLEDFQLTFSDKTEVTVKRSASNVKLAFNFKNVQMLLDCFPWNHGLTADKQDFLPKKHTVFNAEKISKESVLVPQSVKSNKSAIDQRIISDLIKDISVTNGTNYDVKIVFIINASKIFVQFKDNDEKLDDLCKKLNEHSKSFKSDKYSPIKNEIVCCKYKADGNWYRGQVIAKKKDIYRVFFIDFGNEDSATEEDMKPLPKKLSLHKFSLCVSLLNVKDKDISKKLLAKLVNEDWKMKVIDVSVFPYKVMFYQSENSIVDFINIEKSQQKSALILQKLPSGNCDIFVSHINKEKVYVQLFKDAATIEEMCNKINAAASQMPLVKCVELNYIYCALFSDGLWYRASVDKQLSANKYLVTFIDFGNQEELCIENIREIPADFLKYPAFCIPILLQNAKSSQLQLQMKYSVEVVREVSEIQQVKFLVFEKEVLLLSAFKKTFLHSGTNEIVLVHNEGEIYYGLRKEDVDENVFLAEKLKICKKETLLPKALSVGSVVCVKSEDSNYYRGAIEKISSKTSVLIKFIDFGNTELVSLENIYYLSSDFLKYPVFCFPVKINNFEKVKKHVVLNTSIVVEPMSDSTEEIQSVVVVLPKSSYEPNISSFKKQLLPLDKLSDVVILYREEEVFYIQMISYSDEYKSMELKLQSAAQFETLSELPEIGSVVCAKSSDDVWYRGSVEEIFPGSKSCKICFIDFGNNETICVENMKVLPVEFSSYPIFSIPVQFHNLEKLLSQLQTLASVFSVRALGMSTEGVQLIEVMEPDMKREVKPLKEQRLSDMAIEVTVCYSEGDVYYVQVISDEEAMKEMMINLQNTDCLESLEHIPSVGEVLCVKYSDGLWYRGIIKKDCGNSIFRVFFCDFGNTDNINLKDMCYLPSPSDSLHVFSIPIKLSDLNKHVTQLVIDNRYVIKPVGDTPEGYQVVKVRPVVEPVFFTSMVSSKLEGDTTEIRFKNPDGGFHFLQKCADLNKIAELNELLSNFEGEEIFDIPQIEEVLIVKCNDGLWHRGCVRAINQDPVRCKVFLIDEGVTEEILFSNICYMSKKFSSYPAFAIKVLLKACGSSLVSLGEKYNVSVISESNGIPIVQVLTRFMVSSLKKQYLPLNLTNKVIFYHNEGEIFFLQNSEDASQFMKLFKEVQTFSSDKSLSYRAIVGELLVAQSILDQVWYRCCVEEVISCDSYKVRYIDYGNTETVSKDKLRNFSQDLLEYPPFCIAVKIIDLSAKIVLEQEYTVKAENKPENNEAQVIKIVNESKQAVPEQTSKSNQQLTGVIPSAPNSKKHSFNDMSYVNFLSAEQEIVIYTVSSGDDKCYVFCSPFNKDNLLATEKLSIAISNHCNSSKAISFEGSTLEIDEMVLAPYEGSWYRGVVVTNKAAPLHDVLFIDYGNSERVSIEHLRKMQDEFMSLEIQVHICSLSGFKCEISKLSQIADEIKENFTYKPLKASVIVGETDIDVCVEAITAHLKQKKLVS